LAAARQVGVEANLAIAEYVASLIEARAALTTGDRARATERLRRALPLGRRRAFVHHLWFSHAETAELCALAIEHDIEPGYARHLVTRGPLTDP
jgi:hypothetical protein